jgi:5'-methylthioadenosine phosphorylase
MSPIRIGLIGGSGLADALREGAAAGNGVRHAVETPFGPPSDEILETDLQGVRVFCLSRHGPGHTHNPSQVPYRANIFALKQLGVTHVIASGAVGSLREEFRPRDLVIPDQIIDKTTRRPGTFFEKSAVHVEFAEPFCPTLRRILLEAGGAAVSSAGGEMTVPFKVHDRGCYICMEGPAFATRAESLMHRLWGGDLIGMTAMPEAKLAREAEMSYALVALVTDYDCWRRPPAAGLAAAAATTTPADAVDPAVLLKEIIANLRSASENAMRLIRAAVQTIAGRQEQLVAASAERESLRLAIWSDKAKVPPDEVERLRPLWGTYFDSAPPRE